LLDGVGQAELVARGEVTAAELVGWAIERIERLNPALNAVVTPMFDDATAREFFTGVDVWLTPTLSEPPAPIGEIVSTETEPLRALERGGRTVAYSGVIANITGQPAMSVPLWQNADGIPVGVHFLGRFGDEATLLRLAAQLEQARPWMSRKPGIHA
jgi:Asp-tRNA(Asn)/Glu-tRNA(Gln) amidotransferase A subunit family amidase